MKLNLFFSGDGCVDFVVVSVFVCVRQSPSLDKSQKMMMTSNSKKQPIGDSQMFKRTGSLMFLVLAMALALAACGGSSAAQPALNEGVGEGGEGGVEAALVTYSDSAQGFAIGHPGPWTQDTSFTNGVKYVGGDDWMTVEFVNGTDAKAYAQSDVAAISAAFPGFKQLGDITVSKEVKNAVILGFNADGKSSVTGKTFTAHNERYYMPLADGRIAILTVVSPENHYDREGVRDIALTFKVTK